ncbi:MAG: hypothetical protein AAFX44_12100 [Pseudomonadota bacterium]
MTRKRSNSGFAGYDPALEVKVFEFQKTTYPERDPDSIADYWRWLFVRSSERLSCKPPLWLYIKNGEVVAHQGAIPVELWASGETLKTGWFVETMAAESVRGSPIGPMVIKKALEDMPFALSLGQNDQMRQIQFALGWKQIRSLTKYTFVCGGKINLRRKLPPFLAEIAAAGLGAIGSYRSRRHLKSASALYTAATISHFTDEHDRLWQRMAKTCQCVVRRDASYLNWKYVDRPAKRFEIVEIRRDNEVIGVVITSLESPTTVYPYSRGVLVDFVVPLDKEAAQIALLAFAVRRLAVNGAQTVICQVANPALERVLKQFGFSARGEGHQFLISTAQIRGPIAEQLANPENWLLTLGDSDADGYPD